MRSWMLHDAFSLTTVKNPIESKLVAMFQVTHKLTQTITFRFERGMNDALNAEISLGTVSSINDAVQWLGYTYLFVRIKKNPMAYGATLFIHPIVPKSYLILFRNALG